MSEKIENIEEEVIKNDMQETASEPDYSRGGRIHHETQNDAENNAEKEEYKALNDEFLDYKSTDNKVLSEKVYAKIKEVYDPEIPVDIYELGLIYDIGITENNEVVVLMTLTAPSCPEAQTLPVMVENKVNELEEVNRTKVIITFEPPWEMSMMSDEAKLELGML